MAVKFKNIKRPQQSNDNVHLTKNELIEIYKILNNTDSKSPIHYNILNKLVFLLNTNDYGTME